jgi:diguanylate cyclase (GGDEF)-like protein/PAS domain S-box-containing protein
MAVSSFALVETGAPFLEAHLRFMLSKQPRALSASENIAEMLGFTPADFLSSRVFFRDRIHPHDSDVAQMLFGPDLREEPETCNLRVRCADGQILCVRADFTKQRDSESRELILDLCLQDAKSLNRRSDGQRLMANFTAMMENTDDIIFFKDRNHVYTAASRSLQEASRPRLGGGSLIGLTDYDILPEAEADAFYRPEKQILAGADVVRELQKVILPGGEIHWMDDWKYPIKDENGEVIGLFAIARDISDRVQVEETLRESEEALKVAEEIAGLGRYVLDIQSGEWSSSDVLDALFGIRRKSEHTVEEWVALLHPQDREPMRAYFREVVASGRPFNREYRIVRGTDQAVRWMHGLGRTECDAQGRPAVMAGTIQDITERKNAEATLRESKEMLQLFIEHAPAALAMYDREMRVLAFSRRWIEDYGVKDRDVAGRCHYELVPDIPERWKQEHRRALAGESLRRDEDRFERADGTVQWLRRELIPWKLANGEIGGIMIFSEEITRAKLAELALRQSREHLRLFIEHAPAALAMFDREMRYLAVSQRWLSDYGLKGREIIGRSHYEIFPEVPDSWKEVHRRCQAGETIRNDEDRFERADGSVQWVRWEARPWRNDDGSVGGILIFGDDVTQTKLAEDRLRLSASVFTNASEAIVITASDGAILDVNETFTRITGYTRAEVLGRNMSILKSGRQDKEFYDTMWQSMLIDGHWSGEIWNRAKNGDLFAAMETITTVFDASGNPQHHVALMTDITPIKEQERKLEHIAHYDALTGLPNRAMLSEALREAMAQAAPMPQLVAVAYFDLDSFKAVNDLHGRETGDALLAAVAYRLKMSIREGDTLARVGGDEFVAVLRHLESADAATTAVTRLLRSASEPAQIGDLMVEVSASAGVALYPQAEEVDADQLLRQADRAMNQAKLDGKRRLYLFDPAHDRTLRGHLEDIEQIRQALAARQFVLYYQPKVNMAKGNVVGVEALIRWQHPQRGLLGPNLFLPVIDDHPLAIEVGEWVIATALKQMESWRVIGLNVPVSVNVGAKQLQERGFIDRLRALLAAHPGVEPASLEIELLETSALMDMTQTSQLIAECRKLGVSVALDDFGTGYSSLTYLKRLPANVLKIDQSFIRDMLDDAEDLAILEGVLGLASAFRRQAIAEGVETVDHGAMLLQLGCELAQGYGIARPMPADDLPSWVAAWKPDPRWAGTQPVSPADWPVLYAEVELRAWLKQLEAFLNGERNTPPVLDPELCRVGAWLRSESKGPRGSLPAFQAIEELHRCIHRLAADAVAANAENRTADGQTSLAELRHLANEVVEGLKSLIQKS